MTTIIANTTLYGRGISVVSGDLTPLVNHAYLADVADSPIVIVETAHARQSAHLQVRPVHDTIFVKGRALARIARANVFKHFAHYDISRPDPAMLLSQQITSGAAYDSTSPSNFRRVSAQLLVPYDQNASDSTLWGRAAFVAAGVRVKNVASGNAFYIDGAQVELAKNGASAPSAYSPARALQCRVRPNRLNWGWSKSATGWGLVAPTGGAWSGAAPTVVTSGAPDDNGAFLRGTISTASTATGGGFSFGSSASDLLPVKAGVPWSFRSLVRTSHPGSAYLLVRWYSPTGAQVGDNSNILTLNLLANTWTEYRLDGLVPPAGATRGFLTWYRSTGGNWAVGDTMDLAGLIIEQAARAGTYFDGSYGSDYLFESGGSGPGVRSYYYEDYVTRSYLLRQILAENSALGTAPAVPQFALPPLT